jgi:hypothetical protein
MMRKKENLDKKNEKDRDIGNVYFAFEICVATKIAREKHMIFHI